MGATGDEGFIQNSNSKEPTPSPSEEGNSLWLLLDLLDKTDEVALIKTQLTNNQQTRKQKRKPPRLGGDQGVDDTGDENCIQNSNSNGPTPSPSKEGNSFCLWINLVDKTDEVTLIKT